MMAAWMLSSLLVSLLLLAAAHGAERIMRALGGPTRAGWASAVVLALLLSTAPLAGFRGDTSRTPAPRATTAVATTLVELHAIEGKPMPGDGPATSPARPTSASTLGRVPALLVDAAVIRLDAARWARHDATLAALCIVLAAAGLLVVIVSFARLRRLVSRLERSECDGVPVLLSQDVGPAVLGLRRLHVVLPRWVAALPGDDRRAIVLHEQEHARAGDPWLVLLGVVALALQPWNIPLWFIVRRLRFAIEADCDARVLRTGYAPGRYARLLVEVHERGVARISPVTAFVQSTSHLERRIRHMTDRRPPLRSLATVSSLAVALLFAGAACALRVSPEGPVTSDVRPTPDFEGELTGRELLAGHPGPIGGPPGLVRLFVERPDTGMGPRQASLKIDSATRVISGSAPSAGGATMATPPGRRFVRVWFSRPMTATNIEMRGRADVVMIDSVLPPLALPVASPPATSSAVLAPSQDFSSASADAGAVTARLAAPTGQAVAETLLVQPSNEGWPIRVRIIALARRDRAHVTVTDTSGNPVAQADTVIATAPVRILLPDVPFELRVESMSSEMIVTTSILREPAQGPRASGTYSASMTGRSLEVSRASGGVALRLRGPNGSRFRSRHFAGVAGS